MIRRYFTQIFIAITTVIYCSFALMLAARGYSSASNMNLRGYALMADSGASTFDQIVSSFPPMPHVLTIAVERMFPIAGWLGPPTIAAIIAALLVGSWVSNFRFNRLPLVTSLIIAALLALNPLMLRTVMEGPGFVLLHVGLWMTALGVFGLRRGEQINDIILVALGLCIMVFAHTFGIVMVFSLLPFLALVIPPDRLRSSPSAMFMVLLFPLMFAALSFLYINWVFNDGALAFLQGIDRETAGLGSGTQDSIASIFGRYPWALILLGIPAVSPVGVSMFIRTRRLAPLRLSVACLYSSLLSATLLAALYGFLPSASLIAGLGLTIAAACVAKWPPEHLHKPVMPLIIAGFVGGALVSWIDPATESQRWRDAILERPIAPPDKEELQLAKALIGQQDVLFDADVAPAVIAQRGDARGILASSAEEFRFAAMRGRTSAETIVVRNRMSSSGSDRIGQIFPAAYEKGFAGYDLIFDGPTWRVYSRGEQLR